MINTKSISQQPKWPNKEHYYDVISKISTYPQLVFPSEIENLKSELCQVSENNELRHIPLPHAHPDPCRRTSGNQIPVENSC